MIDKTYTQLYTRILAIIGIPSLSTAEQANITEYVNRRAKQAYDATDMWPRFLIANEPRTIKAHQIIEYSEDSFYIYGAGTTAVDGLYKRNGTANSKAKYTLYDSDGTTSLYDIEWDNSTDWQLLDVSDNIIYDITDSSDTPPTSGWAANTGDAPAPTVVDVANIFRFIRIHRTQPFINSSANEYKFWIDSIGAHVEAMPSTADSVAYVTYKKEFSSYTTESTDFPFEWEDFVANAVYSDFLRADGQLDKARAEERYAERYLESELMSPDIIENNNSINNQISTHGTKQARIR